MFGLEKWINETVEFLNNGCERSRVFCWANDVKEMKDLNFPKPAGPTNLKGVIKYIQSNNLDDCLNLIVADRKLTEFLDDPSIENKLNIKYIVKWPEKPVKEFDWWIE